MKWEKQAFALWKQVVRLMRLVRRRDDDWSVLGHRVHIRGEITSGGDLEIRGRVEGDIYHTGRLIIGPGGRCVSNIRADELQIAGEVHGNVHVDDLLELLPTGRLYGDTVCRILRVHPGATLLGATEMLSAVPPPADLPARPAPVPALAGPLAVLSEPVSGRERAELFRPRRAEVVLPEPESAMTEPAVPLIQREPVGDPRESAYDQMPSFYGALYPSAASKGNG
ncbi:MAG: hypothetical protein JWN15_2159 [Firmicutes bacterium]|nr:hypothetical protein [Bacillota bacterium]